MSKRPVVYYDNCSRATGQTPAVFHQFGCDYEEFESGPGNFSTAILELPDGTLVNVHVERVLFTDTGGADEQETSEESPEVAQVRDSNEP